MHGIGAGVSANRKDLLLVEIGRRRVAVEQDRFARHRDVRSVAVFVVIGLDVAAERTGDVPLSLFSLAASLIFGYVSFLLVSYVCYAFVYGLLARTGAISLDSNPVNVPSCP